MFTRRQLLGRSAAAMTLLCTGAAPRLVARHAADGNDRVLVVVELLGGNDGLNTVVPFENDDYYRHRPNLQIAKEQVLRLNDQVGLHPNMGTLHGLFNDGKLAIVQGVGYPQSDRSHARSREIWHTASTAQPAPATGWLGRVADTLFAPAQDIVPALALSPSLPQAMYAATWQVPVVHSLDGYAQADESRRGKLLRKLGTEPETPQQPLAHLRRQAAMHYRTGDKLRVAVPNYEPQGDYPGELGNQLRRAAQVIAGNVGVRLFYASQGGYDTHGRQAETHQNLFGELAGALAGFIKDLEAHKVADKVLVLVFSEFGRRVDENASGGTNHGDASVVFLAGTKVRAGLVGTYPSLAKDKLHDGGLAHTVDFRSVYATIAEKWLGCASEQLLGAKYPLLDLIQM